MGTRTKQIGIRVDPSQERDLTHAAAKLKANQSVILRMALEEYLDNHPDLRALPLTNNDTTQQHLPFPDATQKTPQTPQTRVLFDDDKRTAWLVHYFDHLDQPRSMAVDGVTPAEAFLNAGRMLRRAYDLSNAPELMLRVRFVHCVDLNSPPGVEHSWSKHSAEVATYERILSMGDRLTAAESAGSRAAPLRAQDAEPSRVQEPASSPESPPEPTSPEPTSPEPEQEEETVVAQADAEPKPASQPRRTRKPTPKETPRPRSGKARPGSPSPRTPEAKRRRR